MAWNGIEWKRDGIAKAGQIQHTLHFTTYPCKEGRSNHTTNQSPNPTPTTTCTIYIFYAPINHPITQHLLLLHVLHVLYIYSTTCTIYIFYYMYYIYIFYAPELISPRGGAALAGYAEKRNARSACRTHLHVDSRGFKRVKSGRYGNNYRRKEEG